MIREIEADEIEKVFDLCDGFCSASGSANYKKEVFIKNWENFITNNIGRIFIHGDYEGMLGCILFPDVNTGEITATELFWFVDEKKRGVGLSLLRHFEKFAKENNCTSVIMVHLADCMPEKVKKIYQRFGYKELETHYKKVL